MGTHKYRKTDGNLIDEATARAWMNAYRNERGDDAIRSYFFGTDLFNKILVHPQAVGLRICLGLENGKLQLVLVGTREDGSNIWLV